MRIVKSAEERKDEILNVAAQLFLEKGFDNASTNDIINEMGIARGTLYYHFESKEKILDAIVEKMGNEKIAQAAKIIADKRVPLLERLTASVLALNFDGGLGVEMLHQMHKPQNALLHQKMEECVMNGVVPLYAKLIEEGNQNGIFNTKYPLAAAEMIVVYSNDAFDTLSSLSMQQMKEKREAFIYHTERLLGANEGSLKEAIEKVFSK